VTDVNISRSHPMLPIGTLSLHDAQVSPQAQAQEVVILFQKCAHLPGIVITAPVPIEEDVKASTQLTTPSPPTLLPTVLGVLSRPLFFERGCLSSDDRGWDQPIENFLSPEREPALIVSDRTPILEVARLIRQRSRLLSLEPIVVTFRDGSLRLVESRDVLFAQTQILLEEQEKVEAKDRQIKDYQLQIESQTHVLEELNQMVNVRNITLQNQQRHLERQQRDLFVRTETTQKLRQQLADIRKVLDAQGSVLFQARLELVRTLATNADKLMRADISLAKELEVVIALSETIQQVSRQARFLKLHSAIFINRPQSQSHNALTGFSQVTEGIERLMTQTADADQKVRDSVGHIKLNITELARVAHDIAQATGALIQRIKDTDEVLRELETLADTAHPHESLLTSEQNSSLRLVRSKMRAIEGVSQELGTLYQSKKPHNLRTLLLNLENRLRHR
jgi:hypothetical protein